MKNNISDESTKFKTIQFGWNHHEHKHSGATGFNIKPSDDPVVLSTAIVILK